MSNDALAESDVAVLLREFSLAARTFEQQNKYHRILGIEVVVVDSNYREIRYEFNGHRFVTEQA